MEINNHVLQAIKEIFSEINLQISDLFQKKDKTEKHENYQIISNVGITGDIKGNIMLRTDTKTAKNIVEHMLKSSNIEYIKEEFDSLHKATFTELSNQISARSVMLFSNDKLDCSITPPTLITGNEIKSSIFGLTESVSSNILGKFGKLNIFFGLK